eukprot:scaffold17898_cov59-Phaeocystis_antarctica.AAC.4
MVRVRVRARARFRVTGRVRPAAASPCAFGAPCTDAGALGRSATRRALARRAAFPFWTQRFAPTGAPPPSPPSTRAPALLLGQSCRAGLRPMCSARLHTGRGRWGVCEAGGSEGDGCASSCLASAPNPNPSPNPKPDQRPNQKLTGA